VTVLRNIGLLATCRPTGGQGELHLIQQAAVAWEGDTIRWVGPESELPASFRNGEGMDAGGRLVIPGLVDCHTHLAFGGWRADEFEQRLQGVGYLDIARAGGGIMSTVRATRAATTESLLARASAALEGMRRLGVTTVECKSGYGLDLATELRLLQVYRTLAGMQPTRIVPTFLGAHVVPAEFKGDRAAYLRLVLEEMIPAVAAETLARCCDVFVEDTAFSVDEARQIFLAGKAAGLAPKLHADQLSAGGGATDYTFSDGAQPLWSDIRDARVSLPIRFGLGETTRAIIIPSLRWSAETDADLEDGQTEGVIAAVYWKLSDSLTIGPGLGVFSELTDDTDWFPFLAIDWAITDRWSLSTGQGVGATQGPGLALSYQTTDALSLGVAARYESTQFRLDDGGIAPGGIGESRSVPVVLTLDWRPNPGIGVSAFAGVETGAELTLRDSDGSTVSQSDVDPAAILGAQVIVRF